MLSDVFIRHIFSLCEHMGGKRASAPLNKNYNREFEHYNIKSYRNKRAYKEKHQHDRIVYSRAMYAVKGKTKTERTQYRDKQHHKCYSKKQCCKTEFYPFKNHFLPPFLPLKRLI
jgi:hypothetical protein